MDILISLLIILIGVGALNLSLLFLDKQMNFNLKHWMMSSHGKDKALYLSSRFVGYVYFNRFDPVKLKIIVRVVSGNYRIFSRGN